MKVVVPHSDNVNTEIKHVRIDSCTWLSTNRYMHLFSVSVCRLLYSTINDKKLRLFSDARVKYRVGHIKFYRAIALKPLIISKNVTNKSFSVREGRHTGPPYFFEITPEILAEVMRSFHQRINKCLQFEGHDFEHLL